MLFTASTSLGMDAIFLVFLTDTQGGRHDDINMLSYILTFPVDANTLGT